MSTINTESIGTERDFVISRTIDATPASVFKAWTDPKELAQWWAPRIFTNKCQIDLQVGEEYRITMRSPEGIEYPISGVYLEITSLAASSGP